MTRNLFAHLPGRSFSALGATDASQGGASDPVYTSIIGGASQAPTNPTPMFPLPTGNTKEISISQSQAQAASAASSSSSTGAILAVAGVLAVGAGAYFLFR